VPNPPVSIIKECAIFTKEGGYDFIISVGGGSIIDTAKVASVVATADNIEEEDVSQYVNTGPPRRGLPRIHIPTTAGTGAEVSLGAPITDIDGVKKVIPSEYFFPEVAIIDPLMTINLPPKITADTGMDALSHAIEGYISVKANVVSDMIAEKVIALVTDNLRDAYRKGPDSLEARYNMAVAASLAIHAVLTSSSNLNHGISHTLQMGANCSHGALCSIMLPYVMEYCMLDQTRYARISELMGEKVETLPAQEASQRAIIAVRKLSSDLDMPQRLRDVGVNGEDIPKFVDILFSPYNQRYIENNPRYCSREDATRILEAAW
jgi:alcohol dehydrogenase class IV